ncbi:type II secretion system protein GspI [Ramlibacter humi]|uniref:Prepilin-type N-terminal cleavage/methylation domain-containing protein n=1 Tax=Ramlibacter humi TaxID=2530451 RepID=A0A4Z0BZX7_9BURK|nr:type II secretion system protein GspI [Ramlibacter humi]TFZ03545.1 prepilin-type N-terminal cleavage/methylation domain-containing protein [Ramlibacter humi]
MKPRAHAGFTLVEVLVALAIVAIALAAGAQAASSLATNSIRQSSVMLAQLCAENELVRVRLAKQLPGIGERRVGCRQGNVDFEVAVITAPTPNPNFLRVDAQVFEAASPVLRVSTVVGRY